MRWPLLLAVVVARAATPPVCQPVPGGGVDWTADRGRVGAIRRGAESDRRVPGTVAPMAGFDGVLSTGLPSTASPPALPHAPLPPACSAHK